MDVLDWLKLLLRRCQILSRPEDALELLPDLGVDAPALLPLPIEGTETTVAPVAFAGALTPALGEALAAICEGARAERPPAPDAAELARDPLVLALVDLLLEASAPGPRSVSLVVLETCRQCAVLLHGDAARLRPFGADPAAKAANAAARVEALPEARRGGAWRAVATGISARLAAAWALAGRHDSRLRPTRLHQALMRHKAALLYPAGRLAFPADAATLIAVSERKADPAVITALHSAAVLAITAALGQAEGPGASRVRDLARGRREARPLALDPAVAAQALASLPELVDARALTGAGLSKELAKALHKGEGLAAMIASYVDVLDHLRAWDLLSVLADAATPLYNDGGRWRTEAGALTRRGPWGLLGPRGGSGVLEVSVVALRRRAALADAVEQARSQGHPSLLISLAARWEALAPEAAQLGGVTSRRGELALAVFEDAKAAATFAERAEKALGGRLRLGLGVRGGEQALADKARVAVGVARGPAWVCWDGQDLHLVGAVVEDALAPPVAEEAPVFDMASLGAPPAVRSATPAVRPAADPFSAAPAATAAPDPFAAPAAAPSVAPPRLSDPFAEAPTQSSEASEADDDPFGFGGPPAADDPTAGEGFGFSFQDEDADQGTDEVPRAPAAARPDPFDEDLPEPAGRPTDTTLLDPVDRHTVLGAPPGLAEPPEDDPFQGLPELTRPARAREDPFADPLAERDARETLSPQVLDWELPDPPRAPAAAPEEPARDGGIVSFEIDDDEDSEVSVDVELPPAGADDDEPELFFLPPPAPAPERPAFILQDDGGDDGDDGDGQAAGASFLSEFDDDGQDPFTASSRLGGESLFDFDDLEPPPDLAEPPPAPKPAPAPAASSKGASAVLRLSGAEVAYMFNGYVLVRMGDEHVFGRRYGERLIDAHAYPAGAGLPEAYLRFVTDKIREGFLPQTDLSRPLAAGARPEPLDLDLIGRALSDLGTG